MVAAAAAALWTSLLSDQSEADFFYFSEQVNSECAYVCMYICLIFCLALFLFVFVLKCNYSFTLVQMSKFNCLWSVRMTQKNMKHLRLQLAGEHYSNVAIVTVVKTSIWLFV